MSTEVRKRVVQVADLRSATHPIAFRTFRGSPLREFYTYLPPTAGPDTPLMVLVHGISRRAVEQIMGFLGEAERLGVALLAPVFEKEAYGQYQQLIDRDGTRADLALIDMMEFVGSEFGFGTQPAHLFGFSGGAQFAHRFAMIHPQRVRSMSVAAAGWYTMPDPRRRYPYGIRTHPIPGATFDPRAFLRIDRHVFVGTADRYRDEALRRSPRLDQTQGTTRVERAERWAAAMDAASDLFDAHPQKSTLALLNGVGHSFAGSTRRRSLPRRVMANVFPPQL